MGRLKLKRNGITKKPTNAELRAKSDAAALKMLRNTTELYKLTADALVGCADVATYVAEHHNGEDRASLLKRRAQTVAFIEDPEADATMRAAAADELVQIDRVLVFFMPATELA